jgi:protein-L-isoaspartate O-methyltransferase
MATVSNTDLIEYYAERAIEYERIYAKPERQADLAKLKKSVRATFADQNVLEIACGTGYWTEVLAECAESVLATDINKEVLEIARAKQRIARSRHVQLKQADAYRPPGPGPFSACLAAFWWSHIPKGRIGEFLFHLHDQLEAGAKVMFIDNRYVEDSSTPIHRTDEQGNTYQLRKLDSGEQYEVLKNFPTESELKNALANFDKPPKVELLPYYWVMTYQI